MFLRVI